MDKIPILLLRIEGVLQSWGERANWDRRDTAFTPTKSGVIGLIACAMGLERFDKRIAVMNSELDFSVRVDRPGIILNDFQTVQGIIHTADGGVRGKKGEIGTIVSQRQYLQDASFLVALTGEAIVLENCASALKAPKWQIYLGRKNCIPTRPIFEELTNQFESVEEAFYNYPIAEGVDSKYLLYQIEGGEMLRRDDISSEKNRSFKLRGVNQKTMEVKNDSVENDA